METNKRTESSSKESVKSQIVASPNSIETNQDIIAEAMSIKSEQEEKKETKATKKRSSRAKKTKDADIKEKEKEKDLASEIEIETIYEESKDDIKEKVSEIMDKEAVPELSISEKGNLELADTLIEESIPKKKSTRGRKPKAKEPEKELEVPFEDSLPRKKVISEEQEKIHEEKRNESPNYPPIIVNPPARKNTGITVMCILTALLLITAAIIAGLLFGIKDIHKDILSQLSENNTKTEEQSSEAEEESSVILETTEEIITDTAIETTKETIKETEKETTKKQEETTTVIEKASKKSTGSEELDALCDNILNTIVKDNMTDVEKARAAYEWVKTDISYVMSDKCDTWQEQAIQTIHSYSGDCTGYYAILRALFERIGFECEGVESITKEHIWVIAKVDGEWYHFDATPGWGSDRFMYTTDEMLSYTYYGNEKFPEGLKYSFSTAQLPKD